METETNAQSQSASFFKELGGFMKPYQVKYVLSVIISIISVLCNLGAYLFAGKLAGIIFTEKSVTSQALLITVGIAGFKVMNVILLNLSTWVSHHSAYETLRDIRSAIVEKMLRLPMGYFETNGTGRLKTMLVDRIEGIEVTLAHLLPEMTANMLVPLTLIVLMFMVDWRLAFCILLWLLIGVLIMGGMMIGYKAKYAGQIQAAKSMNQAIVEYVGGIRVIKTFNQADSSYKKFEDAVMHHANYNLDWVKETQFFSSFGSSVTPFSIFPVLIAGLIFFANGSLTGETFLLFMMISLGIYGSIVKAFSFFDQVAQMGTTAKEIRDVLDYKELKRKESNKTQNVSEATVDFSDVTFSYTKDGDKVLGGVSLHVPPHTMLALVGASGGGKSTIAKLLAGYWDATGGKIQINGKEISSYSQEEINNMIAYVDQETFLFDMSIMENIRIGRPSATDEEVIQAAKRAGCDEFIRALPKGYQTPAGSGKLSGGERQRIAIARAMMKNAPIMILDEATASTDPENETAIQNAISKAAAGKTLIVVAHRLKTIVSAEQIAYVEKGIIKAIGTHDKMLKICPEYANMWYLAEKGDNK